MSKMRHTVLPSDDLSIVYRERDKSWIRKKYRPGQRLLILGDSEMTEGKKTVKRRWYTVVERYRNHLSCIDDYGNRESFDYFDLEKIVVKAN